MASRSKCVICKRIYRSRLGCGFSHAIFTDGEEHERERVSFVVDGRCPDCYAPEGRYHHEGCDQEKCPRCELQMLACIDGEFGHQVEKWSVPPPRRRKRRIRVAFAVSDKPRRAHLIILSGSSYLKGRLRDWMGKKSRSELEQAFAGWRVAGIEVIAEERTFPEMATLRASMR